MIVTHLTASTFFGGPERQMLGLAQHLPPEITTTFLSFSEGGRSESFVDHARAYGFDAQSLENDTPRLRAAIRELASTLRQSGTDVLCCHGYKAGLLGRIAARRLHIPVMAISRGWTAENWKVRAYEMLDRLNLRWMDRVICVSEAQAQRVSKARVSDSKIQVIPNAVDPNRFAETTEHGKAELQSLFDSPPELIVGAAGRLSPEKGYDLYVEAALRLVEKHPHVGFVHFGDGPMAEALQQRLEVDSTGRVVLAGFRGDLDYLVPHLDMMVLPSYTEGMPNVVLEANAAGAPVVATAVGGTPEVINHEQTGLLIPPGRVDALHDAIEQLLCNPEQRDSLGEKAKERVHAKFTFNTQAQTYQRLFDKLIGQNLRVAARARPVGA